MLKRRSQPRVFRFLSCVLLTSLPDKPFDRLPRPPSLVAVAQVRPLAVVVVQPSVKIGLQGFDARERLGVHGRAEELLEHGAVEALDKAVNRQDGRGAPMSR